MFITPIFVDGNLTIPIAVMAKFLLNLMGDYSMHVIYLLISISAIITLLHKFLKFESITKNESLNTLFNISPFWLSVRLLGFVIATLIFFGVGPEAVIGGTTGGLIINDLMPILVCVFFLASLLLPLLLNYGLLDFFGALLIKIMRPLFNLPGRSALDCMASWLGDGSVGILMTSKQYEKGYYSKREAAVIATTFSIVSITFSLVVITTVKLEHMFLPFLLTIAVAGIVAAIIVPRIPPLSKIPNEFHTGKKYKERIPRRFSATSYGFALGMRRAKNSPSLKGFFKEGALNTLEMWLGVLPVILALGTLTLIVAEYTSVLKLLGMPFIYVYEFLGIPEAQAASETVIIGFADMFLPALIASEINSELTRFVVAATSVTQLIYMSETGSIILGSKIPVSLTNLFVIFLQRTIITLPIIAIIGKYVLGLQ